MTTLFVERNAVVAWHPRNPPSDQKLESEKEDACTIQGPRGNEMWSTRDSKLEREPQPQNRFGGGAANLNRKIGVHEKL